MIKIGLLVCSLLLGSNYGWAFDFLRGGVSSGGGGAFFCSEENFSELIDLWEAQDRYGYSIKESNIPHKEQIQFFSQKLKQMNKVFGTLVETELENMLQQFEYLPEDIDLHLHHDLMLVFTKRKCTAVGMMYYDGSRKKLYVVKRYFESLKNETHIAASYFHEAIYKVLRDVYGDTDSERARHLVGLLFSTQEKTLLTKLLAGPKITKIAKAFPDCHNYENSSEPQHAKNLYKIVRPNTNHEFTTLKAVEENEVKGQFVFEALVEDARFTTYKCWDKQGHVTGFDPQLLAEVLSPSSIQYVRFISIPWKNETFEGEEQLSFFARLNSGMGHVALSGMSITEERLKWGEMVGPIYKAGKKLMARKDNPNISQEKLKSLLQIPSAGYDSLRGLSVIVQRTSIRGKYFKALKDSFPLLINTIQLNESGVATNYDPTKFNVVEVEDFNLVNKFIDSRMTQELFGLKIDLVMIDTGSTISLLKEGKLGVDTHIVTGDLGKAPSIGTVFGRGDGIALKSKSPLKPMIERYLKRVIHSGTLDLLIERWFKDKNGADSSWAQMPSASLEFTPEQILKNQEMGTAVYFEDLENGIFVGHCINMDPELGPVGEKYYSALRLNTVASGKRLEIIATNDSLYTLSLQQLQRRFLENIDLGYASLATTIKEPQSLNSPLTAIFRTSYPAQHFSLKRNNFILFSKSTYSGNSNFSDVCSFDHRIF